MICALPQLLAKRSMSDTETGKIVGGKVSRRSAEWTA
jgi:hypothetical protein